MNIAALHAERSLQTRRVESYVLQSFKRIPKMDLAVQRCGGNFFPVRSKCDSQQLVPVLQHLEAA